MEEPENKKWLGHKEVRVGVCVQPCDDGPEPFMSDHDDMAAAIRRVTAELERADAAWLEDVPRKSGAGRAHHHGCEQGTHAVAATPEMASGDTHAGCGVCSSLTAVVRQ